MKSSKLVTGLAAALIATGMSACATNTSPDTFNRSEAGRAQSVEWGTVEAVREVMIQNDSRGVATVTGAVLGGIAGSTLGGGRRANTAGAVAGAAAGGAAGSGMSRGARAGVELTVALESGRSVAIAQDGNINDFRVGDRVRVASDGVTTRVSR